MSFKLELINLTKKLKRNPSHTSLFNIYDQTDTLQHEMHLKELCELPGEFHNLLFFTPIFEEKDYENLKIFSKKIVLENSLLKSKINEELWRMNNEITNVIDYKLDHKNLPRKIRSNFIDILVNQEKLKLREKYLNPVLIEKAVDILLERSNYADDDDFLYEKAERFIKIDKNREFLLKEIEKPQVRIVHTFNKKLIPANLRKHYDSCSLNHFFIYEDEKNAFLTNGGNKDKHNRYNNSYYSRMYSLMKNKVKITSWVLWFDENMSLQVYKSKSLILLNKIMQETNNPPTDLINATLIDSPKSLDYDYFVETGKMMNLKKGYAL